MLTIVLLGTGAAVAGPNRDNTSLAIDDGDEVILVDVSGSPTKRLAENSIDAQRLTHLIITHEHVDHTYGLPSLLQSLWLMGRQAALPVYALAETWVALNRLINAYWPGGWNRGFAVQQRVVSPGAHPMIETTRLSIRAAASRHTVPTLALRIESAEGPLVTYSSDTAPCPSVAELAHGSNVLIHEATFLAGAEAEAGRLGHSTSAQAAATGVEAAVQRLVLTHFTPLAEGDLDRLRDGAAQIFRGPIEVPSDGTRIELL